MTTAQGVSSSSESFIKPSVDKPTDASVAENHLQQRCNGAIKRTRDLLLSSQHPEGYWCGELEGDTILESEYILLLAWLGLEESSIAKKCARRILQKQMPEGGWAMYPGGELEISGSVKAYFALKLTGHDAESDSMCRAREAILAHGGVDAVNSFTRFYLALLGQISYDHCPAVPPEAVLLPSWFPINIYQISAWSRTILVPLSIMWAHRPVRDLPEEKGIAELFLQNPEAWSQLRCPGLESERGFFTWERFFKTVDSSLKWCERFHLHPLRGFALRKAEKWMTDRFVDSDGLGAIFPPIVWSVVALKCLGYEDDSVEVRYCMEQLEALMIEEDGTIRLQPCKSPVWDTAITLRALTAAGCASDHQPIRLATSWLLEKEATRKGDWAMNVNCEPGGWYFEHHNDFYPDVDDTIMVMMALRPQAKAAAVAAACERAKRWLLAMQNRDGGWGAFDKDNDREFLCRVPFADHNAMIDPSTPDLVGRVLESLGQWGMRQGERPVDQAIDFLRDQQEADGAWYGRWGVNYIYGVWQVLVGLAAVGVSEKDPMLVNGAKWLLHTQQECGGWGESADSYTDPLLRGQGPPTASQTAWALLGLIASGRGNHPAVQRGVTYLLETQRADGGWDEEEFTGTGFPLVFYLRYHLYPIYFPLLALAEWARTQRKSDEKITPADQRCEMEL